MTSSDRKTAKIYAFPMAARAPKSAPYAGKPTPRASAAVRCAKTEYGSSWYHDAAVNDADKTDKL
ncbi:MAG: DUF2735 domain-containing protein [Filomicrobium sp.]